MSCPISAKMTMEKCSQLRKAHNLACVGCTESISRRVLLDIPGDVYETILADATTHERSFEEHVVDLLTLAATGEYALIRRAA